MEVPNPSMSHFSTSPHSFIYDTPDKSDIQPSFCGRSAFSKPIYETPQVEELMGLDDNIESFNLKNMLIPEMSTYSCSSHTYANAMPINSKPISETSDSNTNGTSFYEINLENDFPSFDVFNFEADDSKLSFSSSDLFGSEFFKSNNPSTCHTPVPTVCTESNSIITKSMEQNSNAFNFIDNKKDFSANSDVEVGKKVTDVGANFLKNNTSLKVNYTPREGQPQLIGVVTPVKKTEHEDDAFIKDLKPDVIDIKDFKSLDKSYEDLKTRNSVSTVGYNFADVQPQIVPSCESLKRKLKTDPDSPPNKKAYIDDDHGLSEDYSSPQRRRYGK